MRRRAFIAASGAAAVWSFGAKAQPTSRCPGGCSLPPSSAPFAKSHPVHGTTSSMACRSAGLSGRPRFRFVDRYADGRLRACSSRSPPNSSQARDRDVVAHRHAWPSTSRVKRCERDRADRERCSADGSGRPRGSCREPCPAGWARSRASALERGDCWRESSSELLRDRTAIAGGRRGSAAELRRLC